MKAPVLAAHDLVLAYGRENVVRGLDLELPPGKVTAIVGANGSGKSTLLRGLARLMKPRAGSVTLSGEPVGLLPSKMFARRVGLLPQSPSAPEGMSVWDLVGRGRYPHQQTFARWSSEDEQAVVEALQATATADLADRYVDELSGGQQQRVWIAMVLAQQTDILLLDEPTTFLDIAHQLDVLELLSDLNRNRGKTVVMVLHDINMAARYSDHLVAMRDGQIYTAGPPEDVVSRQTVERVFDLESVVVQDPVFGGPLIVPTGRPRG